MTDHLLHKNFIKSGEHHSYVCVRTKALKAPAAVMYFNPANNKIVIFVSMDERKRNSDKLFDSDLMTNLIIKEKNDLRMGMEITWNLSDSAFFRKLIALKLEYLGLKREDYYFSFTSPRSILWGFKKDSDFAMVKFYFQKCFK